MIPIRLKIHNFMCYRDVPPLYLGDIHTACISGDNGNGKSAIIDAITWALWGKARTTEARISDDDLINATQAEMAVEFEFKVEQQLYRIIRRHSRPRRRGGSGQTILEFQIATENDFKPISGEGKIPTQQKITDTLHMDYDTFINSAYLRQGHADEFTRQTPAKRKEVLGNILGLSVYYELEEQARELAKQQEMEKTQLESAIKEIAGELEQKPAYETEMVRAQSELSEIEKTTKEHESRLNSLRQERESLENKKLQLIRLEEHLTEAERASERWNEQLRQRHSRVKEYEGLIQQRSTIEEGYTRFIEARKLKDELDQKLAMISKLNQHKYDLNRVIDRAQAALLTEHKLAENKIGELEVKSQKLPRLRSELHEVQSQFSRLAEVEETLRYKKQGDQELQTRVIQLESDKNRLEQEIVEIDEKLKMLLTQTEAKCPLCETELGAEGLKLIGTKYTADKRDKSYSLQSNRTELANQKAGLKLIESEISQLEANLNRDRISTQSKTNILNQQIAEAEEAGNHLMEEKQTLAEIEERLAGKDFTLAEQAALQKIESELTRIAYEPQQHAEVRQRLTPLEQYDNQKRKLEEAERFINQEREAVSRAGEAIQELHQRLESDNQTKQRLNQELSLLPQLINDFTHAETEHQALVTRQRQAQEVIGGLKAKLQHCSEMEIKKAEKENLLSRVSKEENIYQDLAQAFGKKGIQAMLIETALPEIQDEANKLLGRMTDNRMHVKIESQRETKKGDLLETLDINIADELETRNYEMFSGGEAFRINFAIRIALSKLLARRAGAPLPTLIIDEGFGTQDNTGIEKLKEAINSIQDDFNKIFVITHIEELRDAFPTRINVIKTAEGSKIEVS